MIKRLSFKMGLMRRRSGGCSGRGVPLALQLHLRLAFFLIPSLDPRLIILFVLHRRRGAGYVEAKTA